MRLPVRTALFTWLLSLLACLPAIEGALAQQELRLNNANAEKVSVPVGTSRVFTTAQDVSRLVIGDPEIADVVLISPRSFYVLGQGLGRTNLMVFADEEFPIGLVDLDVTVDMNDLTSALRSAVPGAAIRAESVNGRLRLHGTVPDAVALDRALEIADQYGSEEVINAIQVSSPQQVFLEVRMIEASRNAGKSLGVNLNVVNPRSDGQTAFSSGGSGGSIPFGSFLASLVQDGLNIDLLIEALEERGLARNLAEPTLAALSGETASFLAGGEVPIPVSAGDDGDITIEFKEFGVRLSFTPIVLNNGLINLTLEPEVSQVDFSNTFDTGLVQLPSFSTRRASTTIELSDGQSFAIAGLLQRNNSRNQQQVPWLGEVPILGTLFRSASFQKEETDLVIIVTPRLSRPADSPSELQTPLDFSMVTREDTFFLFGIQEITRAEMTRQLEKRGITEPFGHITSDDYVAEGKYDAN